MTTEQHRSMTVNRRRVLKLMAMTGGAAAFLQTYPLFAIEQAEPGYGPDPDLLHPRVPWGKSLTKAQLRALARLGDLIIPADEHSPSASDLDIAGFVNEWVSAPYPVQRDDRTIILAGLEWLDKQARRQRAKDFNSLAPASQASLFDGLASAVKIGAATSATAGQARFFERLVYLFAGGFYTTTEGMADIGYVGNVPLSKFDGPPAEIRRRIGV